MNILIAEDEPVIAQRIERLTRELLGTRVTRIKKFTTFEEANSYLMTHHIDLLFLDLNLKGKDGFHLLEGAQAGSFYTVIISAYGERAIQAFDYPVIDFIEKPFGKERLARTFQKLENFAAKNRFTSKFLSLKSHGEIKLIDVDRIVYLEGAGVYSEVVLDDAEKLLHHQNLGKVNLLLPSNFIRIHKSYIVNFNYVETITSHGGSTYSLIVNNGIILPISRNRYPAIKALVTGT